MSYYLGIDIGTTYTAAAVWRDGRYEIAGLGNRAPTIPSVVLLRDDHAVLTGEAAARRAATEPGRVAREFKRRVGDPTPIIVGGTPYSADALIAKLLRWVVDQVSEVEGGPPAGIAVSHPANWGNYKLDLLGQAVSLADLDGVVTVSEPEAAAIHYASQARVEPGSVIAVYDLGGGTFDAAVLRKTRDGWQILGAPEGIERLGGVDFDQAVFHHVAQALGGAVDALDPDDPTAQAAVARLRQECVDAKEALSSDSDVSIPVMLPHLQTEVRLTRAEYEGMVRPALSDTITAMNRALRSADVTPEGVTAVLLVGGSSRTPLVAELVSSALGRPVAVDAHPKHGVALGAAITAATRAGATGEGTGAAGAGGAAGAASGSGVAGRAGGAAVAGGAAAAVLAGDAAGRDEPAPGGGRDDEPARGGGSAMPLPATHHEEPGAGQPAAATRQVPPVAPAGPAATGPEHTRPTPAEPGPTRVEPATVPYGPVSGPPDRRGLGGRDPRSVTVPYLGGDQADRPAGRVSDVRSPSAAAGHDRDRPGRRPPARDGDHVPPRPGGGNGGPSRRPLLVAVGAIVVLALLGGAALLALGDDDDPEGGAAAASDSTAIESGGATTAPDTTPTTEAPPAGPFVRIADVQLDGDRYRVTYDVSGYTPEIGGEGTLHVHFFPDTQPADTAGANGAETDDWDLTDEQTSFLTKYTPETVVGATQMCAGVANHLHEVHQPQVRTGNCAPLP